MKVQRIALLGLFTAAALIIHIIESFIPAFLPVPGVKPGFANIVTLFMVFAPAAFVTGSKQIRAVDVYIVLICRVLLGAFIAGRIGSLVFALSGGFCAVTVQLAMRRYTGVRQIWACGAAGAVAHNIGQISAAVAVTGTPGLFAYLPVLVITGILTGAVTGLITQFAVMRFHKF